MVPSKLEVLVDFGESPDQTVLGRTLNELKSQDEVSNATFKDGAIMVETTLPSSKILELVTHSSGKRAVLQGFGETQSAVAMISNQCENNTYTNPILGVIRFQQTASGPLICDGSIDGLTTGVHGLNVHSTGDLSQGCASIGPPYYPKASEDPAGPPGGLGRVTADEAGRATFRIVADCGLQVSDIIGRSVAVTEGCDDLGKAVNAGLKPIACGIIARSAGVLQNPKRICMCDGVVVWDERDKPIAGKGRRKPKCCDTDSGDAKEVKPCCKV